MVFNGMVVGLFFLFQIVFGVLGNSFLLGLYTIIFFIGLRVRPIDLILCHLAFVNNLVLLSKGIPQTMVTLGLNNFLNDMGCKFVFYLHRVTRGLSLCTTSLLSGFQAITLSPRSSKLSKFKVRVPKCMALFCLLCWTFHLVTNYYYFLYFKAQMGSNNTTERIDLIYCTATIDVLFNYALYVLIISLPDVFCIVIMAGASGYIIFVLYRHHQRVQYIHGNNLTLIRSPETRATQITLLLVCMFVSFYSLNSVLILHLQFGKPIFWLIHVSTFLSACFSACSPFVLIVIKLCSRQSYEL
uniref:Vomeronasal type-1 receptor n=1 Tax=Sarcophilus harrisii TaxID=9305 RepID=A0A7N4PSC5_SARHA